MMLENLNAIEWDKLHHAHGSASKVPNMLHELDNALDNKSFLKQYRVLMEAINHQGAIYDSTCHVVPFIIQMLKQSTDSFRIIHHLIILAELLRHTSRPQYQPPTFPASVVPQRWLIQVYEAVGVGIPYYLKLLQNEDEHIHAGSIYVLSFLVDEYTRILSALHRYIDGSDNEWLKSGGIWAFARVASFELGMIRDADQVTKAALTHLKLLDVWAQDTKPFVRMAAALGYITVLASDWAQPNLTTPNHVVEHIQEAIQLNEWRDWLPTDDASSHFQYVYSEIAPFHHTQSLVIRWCNQAATPTRWAALINGPLLTAVKAHELVREMLDANFRRLSIRQDTHSWLNHNSLQPSVITDGIIYKVKDSNSRFSKGTPLNDHQRMVLQVVCDCDPFWQLHTNLLSFFYGLPDDRDSLHALSKKITSN